MNKTQILDVCRELERKGFSQATMIREHLLEILFHLHVARFEIDLLAEVDFGRTQSWEDLETEYAFGNPNSTITCRSKDEVQFHVKRLVSGAAMALDCSTDKLWTCVKKIYLPNPPLDSDDGILDHIDQFCSSDSALKIIQFTKDHLKAHEQYRRLISHVRNKSTHVSYSVVDDMIIHPRTAGYSNPISPSAKAIFDRDETLGNTISYDRREYKTFFSDAFDVVKGACDAFLVALAADLADTKELPITFDAEIPTESD